MKRQSFIYKFLKKCEHPQGRFWDLMNTLFCSGMNIAGLFYYKRIVKDYPGRKILIMPSASMGDVVILNAYIDEILIRFGIDKYILVIDDRLVRVANQIKLSNVVGLKNYVISSIVMSKTHKPNKLTECYNIFSAILFDKGNTSVPLSAKYPIFDPVTDIALLCNECGVTKDKTVILAPYEQHITVSGRAHLDIGFWEQLASKLMQEGYNVVTNCNINAGEMPINETKIFFPKICEIGEMVDFAGSIIGVRSGLFDYLGNTKAKKIVLYPDKSFLEMWSVEKMWQMNNIMELVYNDFHNDQLLEECLAFIRQ